LKLRPQSLLGQTVITIALTLAAFMVISMGAAVYFIYLPMAQRSADDFAAVIVSAAHSLQSLPEEMHAELQEQLLADHGLIVAAETTDLTETSDDVPYFAYFRNSLKRRAGEALPITTTSDNPLVWVDVPAHGKTFRLGFDRERAGTNPPVALLLAIGGGALLTFVASMLEVRRVVKPLNRLSLAVQELGSGHNPPPLLEDGPRETAELARAFNRMSDLAAMNSLIGQFLQFSRGIEKERPVELDLWETIESQSEDLTREGAKLQLDRHDPPCVYFADPVALARVLSNLLANAAYHGGDSTIDVELHCNEQAVTIEISDRGPGIPADQIEAVFQPFHRLETARGNRTGGSGLGLAIARQLAIKHGWTIDLLPRDGGGTVARVGLPPAHRRCSH